MAEHRSDANLNTDFLSSLEPTFGFLVLDLKNSSEKRKKRSGIAWIPLRKVE